MILTHKQIHIGEMLPRFYGIAWHHFSSDTATCYLWPFNIILAWIRKYWQKARYYRVSNPLEIQAMEAISKREDDISEQGYRRGFHDASQVTPDEIFEARKRGAREMLDHMEKEIGRGKG